MLVEIEIFLLNFVKWIELDWSL